MKKTLAVLLCAALLLVCALASAEINVTRRTLGLTEGLDKNVNHILVILQDGDTTNTLMLASINSRTGRSVMTRIASDFTIELTDENGQTSEMPLGSVYVRGDKKSRGLLVCREINEALGLNVGTYVAMDIAQLPKIVDALGSVNMGLTEAEAAALGMTWDYHDLTGEQVLSYIRLSLPEDDGSRSRCYDILMRMLYQGVHSGDLGGLVSMGTKMMKSMDTNMNPMTAMTMVSAVQAGDDRREIAIDNSLEDPRALVHKEIYE